jgi:hypothetical protein
LGELQNFGGLQQQQHNSSIGDVGWLSGISSCTGHGRRPRCFILGAAGVDQAFLLLLLLLFVLCCRCALQPKDWSIKMNKKERRLALATALQSAAGDVIVTDDIAAAAADGKTKTLVSTLEKLGAPAGMLLELKLLLCCSAAVLL